MIPDRLTERSLTVVSVARREAARLGENRVSGVHLLLGIILEGGGMAAKILKNLGVKAQSLQTEVERDVPVTVGALPADTLLFAPDAQRAYEAADRLTDTLIGTEHLLLGILEDPEGPVTRVLTSLRVKVDELKDMVLEVMGADVEEETREDSGADELLQIKRAYLGYQEAKYRLMALLARDTAHPGSTAVQDLEDARMLERRKLATLFAVLGRLFPVKEA